ncbi:MAG: hypothetical protein FWD82_00310 [Defluviitaleaceae bacterium]|nr:hypothetical protein [Defluviitaleaceae bacterium]
MATKVGRSLDEIDSKVKQLSSSIKESSKKTKELDRTLRLDPSNTRVAAQQMRALGAQIGQATQKVALLRQRKAEANRELQQGDITAAEFAKIEKAVEQAELELQRFNAQMRATKRMQVQVLAQRFDRVTRSMQQAQRVARTFSRLMLGLVGIMAASVTAFTRNAVALNETAEEFGVGIRQLQIKNTVSPENEWFQYRQNYKGCTVSPPKNMMGQDNGQIQERIRQAKISIRKEKTKCNPRS